MSTTAQEVALMKKDIETLSEDVRDLNRKIDMLMAKLLDPDKGLVVRVNKNTHRLDERESNMSGWLRDIDDFHHMKRWKDTVTKALWVVYAALIGLAIRFVFWQ